MMIPVLFWMRRECECDEPMVVIGAFVLFAIDTAFCASWIVAMSIMSCGVLCTSPDQLANIFDNVRSVMLVCQDGREVKVQMRSLMSAWLVSQVCR